MHNVACRLAPCLEERQCRKNPTKQKDRAKAVTGTWQIEKAAGHFPPPKTAPRLHHEVSALGGADQATDGRLPFFKILLNLRQLHDVVGGVFDGD
jgi:hypothetical protein